VPQATKNHLVEGFDFGGVEPDLLDVDIALGLGDASAEGVLDDPGLLVDFL